MFCKFCIPKFYANISRHIPLAEGRFEMLRYLQEQSLSIDYHRVNFESSIDIFLKMQKIVVNFIP